MAPPNRPQSHDAASGRDRGRPSEVIGSIGHSGYLTKTSETRTRLVLDPPRFPRLHVLWLRYIGWRYARAAR